MTSLRERLLAKAVINWETGCWEWTADIEPRGYGRIRVGGRNGYKGRAHRISYEMTYGPIPAGLVIDHLCRVRHCINPAHLEAVTSRENTLRGLAFAAGTPRTYRKTHCKHGHEYTPENSYITRTSGRLCRACMRNRDAGRRR